MDEDQTAILVDNDHTINSEELLKDLPFKNQIKYIEENLTTAIMRPDLRGQDVVVANGIICYVWDKFPQILAAVKSLLQPGGHFIFEVYPKHWEWARNRDIKGYYLPLHLFESCNEALAAVESVARTLGITDISHYRYYDDFKNEIMILFDLRMP